ncbi:MAG: Acid phosphatase [Pedosphaera sp.]|nr:Acid phosphatase [Pedosphaera sp.]
MVCWLSLFALTLNAAEGLHFLVTGDTGSGQKEQKDVAEAMAVYAVAHRDSNAVNFVILTGDNFYEKGVATTDDPQWQEKFEQVYDPQRLPMPFFAVLGNHDWRYDHPDAQINYARAHPGTRWQMDGHWYHRQFPGVDGVPLADFFFVDTMLWDDKDGSVAKVAAQHLGEKQMAWLDQELKKSKAVWKIVVAHHPIYSDGAHGHEVLTLKLRERLSPRFKERGVDAFLTGHDHDMQRAEVPGHPTLFLTSGAGSRLRPRKYEDWKPFFASSLGFAAIHLSATEMRGEFIDVTGKQLDVWHRPPISGGKAAGAKAAKPD